MASFIISYDLREGENCKELTDAIKETCTKWLQAFDSTWVITCSVSAKEIQDALKPYLPTNGRLLVVKLTGSGAWKSMDAKAKKWLKENL
jgi:hypothetical protein